MSYCQIILSCISFMVFSRDYQQQKHRTFSIFNYSLYLSLIISVLNSFVFSILKKLNAKLKYQIF